MDRSINRLKWFFVIAFTVLTGAMLVYQFVWQDPKRRCEEQHNWWDGNSRQCGKVIYIPAITGRPIGAPPRPAPAATVPSPPQAR